MAASETPTQDAQVQALRNILTSEQEALARRFRALFSLKYLASLQPPTEQTVPAIEAIAAAFSSPSALLKHELAYCLGQSRNDAAIDPLRYVLQNKDEDPMCRHEAAEALGALGDKGSLELLKGLRDDAKELDVVRETCDIAVDRIEWEHGLQSKDELLKKRYDSVCLISSAVSDREIVTSPLLIPPHHCLKASKHPRSTSLKRPSLILHSHFSSATGPCLLCGTSPHHRIYPPRSRLFFHWRGALLTHPHSFVTRSLSFSGSCHTPHPFPA